MTQAEIEIPLPDESATDALAQALAANRSAGDVILLSGPVGSGKSAFARAMIRHLCEAPLLDVPSPTYTLVQTYTTPTGLEIWHVDLYRLADVSEVIELGLTEAFDRALCLVEWPDRLAGLVPPGALTIALSAGQSAHRARLTGPGRWTDAIETVGG